MGKQFDLIIIGAGPGGYVRREEGGEAWNVGSNY